MPETVLVAVMVAGESTVTTAFAELSTLLGSNALPLTRRDLVDTVTRLPVRAPAILGAAIENWRVAVAPTSRLARFHTPALKTRVGGVMLLNAPTETGLNDAVVIRLYAGSLPLFFRVTV